MAAPCRRGRAVVEDYRTQDPEARLKLAFSCNAISPRRAVTRTSYRPGLNEVAGNMPT